MALTINNDAQFQEYLVRASVEAERVKHGIEDKSITPANFDKKVKLLDALIDSIIAYINAHPQNNIRMGGEDVEFILKPEKKTPEKQHGETNIPYHESAVGAVDLLNKIRNQLKTSAKKEKNALDSQDNKNLSQFHHWFDDVFHGLHWKYGHKDASKSIENTAWAWDKDIGTAPARHMFYSERENAVRLPALDLNAPPAPPGPAPIPPPKPAPAPPLAPKPKEEKKGVKLPSVLFGDAKRRDNILRDAKIGFKTTDASRFVHELFVNPARAASRPGFINDCKALAANLQASKPADAQEKITGIKCVDVKVPVTVKGKTVDKDATKLEVTTNKATHDIWLGKDEIQTTGKHFCPAVYAVMAEAVRAQLSQQLDNAIGELPEAEIDKIRDNHIVEITATGVSKAQLIESGLALVNEGLIPAFPAGDASVQEDFVKHLDNAQIERIEARIAQLSPAQQKKEEVLTLQTQLEAQKAVIEERSVGFKISGGGPGF